MTTAKQRISFLEAYSRVQLLLYVQILKDILGGKVSNVTIKKSLTDCYSESE